MERGLLWLPLLGVFLWLAWSGWNEYQKVEAYRIWEQEYDRAKYDIYSVLGQKGKQLTWGKPTRSGPVELKTFSLVMVRDIRLLVDGQPVDLENLPSKGTAVLEFSFADNSAAIEIPFTQISMAAKWGKYLLQELNKAG
ncbi:MAG: hypothetical protein QNJ54_14365 [Prochloraceae cyanobacterium]|nr:hypothetical protein [Prochloraceae cyanobacterium]